MGCSKVEQIIEDQKRVIAARQQASDGLGNVTNFGGKLCVNLHYTEQASPIADIVAYPNSKGVQVKLEPKPNVYGCTLESDSVESFIGHNAVLRIEGVPKYKFHIPAENQRAEFISINDNYATRAATTNQTANTSQPSPVRAQQCRYQVTSREVTLDQPNAWSCSIPEFWYIELAWGDHGDPRVVVTKTGGTQTRHEIVVKSTSAGNVYWVNYPNGCIVPP